MNYLLTRAIEGKIEGTKERGRRRKQILDDFKEKDLELERRSIR